MVKKLVDKLRRWGSGIVIAASALSVGCQGLATAIYRDTPFGEIDFARREASAPTVVINNSPQNPVNEKGEYIYAIQVAPGHWVCPDDYTWDERYPGTHRVRKIGDKPKNINEKKNPSFFAFTGDWIDSNNNGVVERFEFPGEANTFEKGSVVYFGNVYKDSELYGDVVFYIYDNNGNEKLNLVKRIAAANEVVYGPVFPFTKPGRYTITRRTIKGYEGRDDSLQINIK